MFILMKQYGRAILICITAMLILGIMFFAKSGGKKGFIAAAYETVMEDLSESSLADCTDTDAVRAAAARKKPDIVYTYEKTLPGSAVNLDHMFEAQDAEGNRITAEITDILDPLGKSILYLTKEDRKLRRRSGDTKRFLFTETGIYTICVKAVDAEKKRTNGQYRLPVTSH